MERHETALTSTRRRVLANLGAAAPLALMTLGAARADEPAPARLPVAATFIEHLGVVATDVTAAARFHSRLFNPAIMREANPTPPRYYVNLTPGYLAFGGRTNQTRAVFDHYCVLLQHYDQDALAVTLGAIGLPQRTKAFTLFPDPDGIGVQFYQHPGGWFPTVAPADPLVQGPPLVTPHGLEHVMLSVADVDRSVAFYRRIFGALDSKDGDTVWFGFPDTRLGIRAAPVGTTPGIDHIRVRVRPFDPAAIAGALEGMGATVAPRERDVLRFRDPQGLALELKPA